MLLRVFNTRKRKAAAILTAGVLSTVAFNQARDRWYWWADKTVAEVPSVRFLTTKGINNLQGADITARERFILMGKLRKRANEGDSIAMLALLNQYTPEDNHVPL